MAREESDLDDNFDFVAGRRKAPNHGATKEQLRADEEAILREHYRKKREERELTAPTSPSEGLMSAFPELSREELESLCLKQNARVAALLEACKRALPYLASHIAMTLDEGPGDRIAHDHVEASIALATGEK